MQLVSQLLTTAGGEPRVRIFKVNHFEGLDEGHRPSASYNLSLGDDNRAAQVILSAPTLLWLASLASEMVSHYYEAAKKEGQTACQPIAEPFADTLGELFEVLEDLKPLLENLETDAPGGKQREKAKELRLRLAETRDNVARDFVVC